MNTAELIIHNAQLVTCASNGQPKRLAEMQNVGLIENGAIAVSERKNHPLSANLTKFYAIFKAKIRLTQTAKSCRPDLSNVTRTSFTPEIASTNLN